MEELKYKFTEKTIEYKGYTLHQIIAISSFGDVKVGDVGGFIESEENLSQYGLCWVYDNSKAFGNAKIYDDASVHGKAEVSESACLRHKSTARGKSFISGKLFYVVRLL